VTRGRTRGGVVALRALARAPSRPLQFLTDLSREYGDVAPIRFGPIEAVLLTHPEHVAQALEGSDGALSKGRAVEGPKRLLGDGLLTSEGAHHGRQRLAVEPAFAADTLARGAAVITGHAERARERWAPGQTIDAFEELGRLAHATAVGVITGEDVDTPSGRRFGETIADAFDAFDRLPLSFIPAAGRLPIPANDRFRAARRDLDEQLLSLLARRRFEPQSDLLSAILQASEEHGGASDVAIRDEVVNLFSGHKSVAVALTWSLYLLARHPELQDRVSAEVEALGRIPTAEDIGRLAGTRAHLAEAMRLFPPVWVLARKASTAYEIGGRTFRKGAFVLVSAWVTHRDGRFFPDPRRCDPSRFHPGADPDRPRFAYFPFGGGPRSCVGEPLAWLEGTLVLAMLVQRWRFRTDLTQRVQLAPRVTLKPKDGVRLVVDPRG
jgi:cytochrome P450